MNDCRYGVSPVNYPVIKGSLKLATAFTTNLRKFVFRIPWSRRVLMVCKCCIESRYILGFLNIVLANYHSILKNKTEKHGV